MDDLISKSQLMNTIATEVHFDTEHPLEAYGKLMALINNAPVVARDFNMHDTEKHGHWITNPNPHTVTCSICGNIELSEWAWDKADYCPHCGAKMDAESKPEHWFDCYATFINQTTDKERKENANKEREH